MTNDHPKQQMMHCLSDALGKVSWGCNIEDDDTTYLHFRISRSLRSKSSAICLDFPFKPQKAPVGQPVLEAVANQSLRSQSEARISMPFLAANQIASERDC
ncbi:hypothetical protein TREMEDRAFT_65610 [Tremella mesenterica DSM 1558]|uniref:uncharacterized protein n=1 Tax=Tremella mesenterica (strain ATCC 24925 / CBS 8224 / DSM 1558 / NBRC 9311 / NRRL Y-6157 / RJB 2259-6 / UBC 559-6) TaxID=578456 RepID=UPI00032BDD2B|nr:uncharacterized protein TREMEDRAFT_65610 [Tremella mesenterica DSM 1558]EIW66335.1 hypothetical protein TREMEDRAFT_65610 [Tremella mesenterica DSM 1558]